MSFGFNGLIYFCENILCSLKQLLAFRPIDATCLFHIVLKTRCLVLLGSSYRDPVQHFRRRIIKSLSEQCRHTIIIVASCLGIASNSFLSFWAVRETKNMSLAPLYLQLVGTLHLSGIDRRHEPGPVPRPSVWQSYVLIGSILMYTASSGINKMWDISRKMAV
jgi:hypothetical protein